MSRAAWCSSRLWDPESFMIFPRTDMRWQTTVRAIYTAIYLHIICTTSIEFIDRPCPYVRPLSYPVAEWPLPVACRSPNTRTVNHCFWHAASELYTRPYSWLYTVVLRDQRRVNDQTSSLAQRQIKIIIKKNKTVAVWPLSHLTGASPTNHFCTDS